jgi:ABC-type nitrate/sulfonate/bicarbonate transport system, ATPase component
MRAMPLAAVPSQSASTAALATVADPILSVNGVTLQYTTQESVVTASFRVSFDVHRADRYVLLGPSGCGKSTLLKAIGGFIDPVEGVISVGGRKVRGPGPDRMMVFQEFDQLMPWKTVEENITYPMLVSGRFPKSEITDRARRFIAKVKLEKFRDSYPHMLSGGMKQRVAIARGMAMEPDVLLMDEPFAALDALTRRQMQQELLELWDETRFTVIFVTHSIEEAVFVGSRVLLLSPHPGQVRAELNCHHLGMAEQGTPEFGRLCKDINDMLFDKQLPEDCSHG